MTTKSQELNQLLWANFTEDAKKQHCKPLSKEDLDKESEFLNNMRIRDGRATR